MKIAVIIQARMGSTRLPGKMMLPLNGEYVLAHDIHRAKASKKADEVVVATSTETADNIIAQYTNKTGATVFRGSESDVLDRMFRAADQVNADTVVRITGDCPLLPPDIIDTTVERLIETEADYCTNILERTFPRGFDVEAFTFESFERVHEEASAPHHREHVTPFYREHDDQFDLVSVTSDDVFEESWMQDRTDLRLTLDEADDYELLRQLYDRVEYENILPVKNVIKLIDEEELNQLNSDIEQKKVTNASDNQS